MDGVVEQRNIENGERVSRGAELFTVVRSDVLELTAAVPARRASALARGLEVRFTADGRAITGRVARVSPTIDLQSQSITVYVQVPNATGSIALGDGTVGYEGELEFLGQTIAYQVTATPTAAGSEVLLQPVGVEVGAGGGSLDLSGIVERVLGSDPIAVCVAEYLPEGIEVTEIAAAPGVVRVELEGTEITLDEAHLQQTGSCD